MDGYSPLFINFSCILSQIQINTLQRGKKGKQTNKKIITSSDILLWFSHRGNTTRNNFLSLFIQAIICSQLLNLVSPTCSVPKDGFVTRCQLDMQDCSEPGQNNCTCSTLSEYSRQCAMSHQMVFNWRTENFCCKSKCFIHRILYLTLLYLTQKENYDYLELKSIDRKVSIVLNQTNYFLKRTVVFGKALRRGWKPQRRRRKHETQLLHLDQ